MPAVVQAQHISIEANVRLSHGASATPHGNDVDLVLGPVTRAGVLLFRFALALPIRLRRFATVERLDEVVLSEVERVGDKVGQAARVESGRTAVCRRELVALVAFSVVSVRRALLCTA